MNFTLPWPGSGALVLFPQSSATRPASGLVKIVESSGGGIASDGSSLTLTSAAVTDYTLQQSGRRTARGLIRFTPPSGSSNVSRQACRDRSLALYDVGRATLNGSPLRIVGVVAPPGTVTIDGNGGIAHFRSARPGTYRVSIVTANDAGAAGPLVSATISVI